MSPYVRPTVQIGRICTSTRTWHLYVPRYRLGTENDHERRFAGFPFHPDKAEGFQFLQRHVLDAPARFARCSYPSALSLKAAQTADIRSPIRCCALI